MEQNENASNAANTVAEAVLNKELLKKFNFWEKDRLESFKKWPFDDKSPCNTAKMAEAGFYWCGTDTDIDSAACFLCNKHLDGWEIDDDPWSEHFKHAPQCQFAKTQKAEKDLTVEEVLNIFEIMLKNNVERKFTEEKKNIKQVIDQKRKELTKAMMR
ncbi:baculoviral IAP repeat-containing protein 5 [Culicoides brevitarsis]|uniref:baculoviral IAP repeat-containing protein 5 n=1 Tax=Culicoides brevitarsis TaxID=469753 RepID=UPI00307C0F41